VSKSKTQSATAAQETQTNGNADGVSPSTLPLFYKKPVVLEAARHAKSGVTPTASFAFAKGVNALPINAIEFIETVKSYPIVFNVVNDVATPLAVVGMEQENLFITAEGQWREGDYVPAYLRQYPFVFYEEPNSNRFYLCIDESSEQFHAEAGENVNKLYEGQEPSELTKHALEFCSAYYRHHAITKNLCADLVKHGLLNSYHSKVTKPDGREINLAGFSMIDEAAFNKLSEKTFLEFREKGWLAFIYLALASASNWKRLADLTP
jgi:hypothetical protein